ncbi:MAG: hypothetical protein CMJ79_08470 [Planctomycetaceae bacterium]|jgi:hypothetical protein|nr:hypothetical protein [Planctomycetaceae bacterium]|tara:strand:- start:40245 stop:41489 length:1245 start_codon:yes stop_codon:yes gene_type:complete
MKATRHASRAPTVWIVLFFISITSSISAQDEDIDVTYGQGNQSEGRYSINGTGVLAKMFEDRGHSVFYSRVLGRPTRKADVIIWAPDNFHVPTEAEVAAIEQWLQEQSNRTFIFIGRDYDATMDYWVEVAKGANPEEKTMLTLKLADVWGAHQVKRMAIIDDEDCGWFKINADSTVRTIRSARSTSDWLEGITPGALKMRLQSYFVESDKGRSTGYGRYEFDTQLFYENIPLVTRIQNRSKFNRGQIYLIANGSFLLNVPLVHREHRKLASKLIERVGRNKTICFLESEFDDWEDVPVLENAPSAAKPPSIVTILQTWPFGIILIHIIVIGIVYCFYRFPIFGRPRAEFEVNTVIDDSNEKQSVSNFGRHIRALGDLLRRGGNATFANHCLQMYRQRSSEQTTYKPQKQKKKPT